VSQVGYELIEVSIEEMVRDVLPDGHILLVEKTENSEIYFEKLLPADTHYEKNTQTPYQEFIYQYKILDVIKSNNLTVGEKIWIWAEPAWPLSSVELYHEEGLMESPIILQSKPVFPIDGKTDIIFIDKLEDGKNKKYKNIFTISHTEGSAGKSEILKALASDI